MQPERPAAGSPSAWLRYARSDLAYAQIPRPPEVLLEALCFNTQQAAEKAIKAVLVLHGIGFPKIHDLKTLLGLLPSSMSVPPAVESATVLTDYAAFARYPSSLEPVGGDEYARAVEHARSVVAWAEAAITGASH